MTKREPQLHTHSTYKADKATPTHSVDTIECQLTFFFLGRLARCRRSLTYGCTSFSSAAALGDFLISSRVLPRSECSWAENSSKARISAPTGLRKPCWSRAEASSPSFCVGKDVNAKHPVRANVDSSNVARRRKFALMIFIVIVVFLVLLFLVLLEL